MLSYINVIKMRTITNYILALLLTSLCVASAHADENILNIYRGDATTVGIYVKDLRSGEVLASHNASRAILYPVLSMI